MHMKEGYKNVKAMLDMINSTSNNWDLCGDFKMLAFLLGQQGVTQSVHAFSAYGIAELMISIIQESSGHSEKN